MQKFGERPLVTMPAARSAVLGSVAVTEPAHFSNGFTAAMRVAAVLSLAGALVGLWLPGRRSVVAALAPQVGEVNQR